MLVGFSKHLTEATCEVRELPTSQVNAFMIYKNASSSLRDESKYQNGRVWHNSELISLDRIDIFFRDPTTRYYAGIATYVDHLLKKNPDLDITTILHFVNNYRFLNLHFAPQILWLINLGKWIDLDRTILHFHSVNEAQTLTKFRSEPTPDLINDIKKLIRHDNDLKLWLYIDQELMSLITLTYSYRNLIRWFQSKPNIWANVFVPNLKLCLPYYGMPKT